MADARHDRGGRLCRRNAGLVIPRDPKRTAFLQRMAILAILVLLAAAAAKLLIGSES